VTDSPWRPSWCADPSVARLIVDHYSRQHPEAAQFMPPGRKLVLRTADGLAAWGMSWPYAEYVNRDWPGAWLNSPFCRKGGQHRASDLIRLAVAHTIATWGTPPREGMVTIVDASRVAPKPGKYRTDGAGWCYRKAGFREVGQTKGGLLVFQLLPEDMPEPTPVPPWAVTESPSGEPVLWGDAA
jgi:hypothetical protein